MTPIEHDITLLESSPLFDGAWYVARYRDVGQLGIGAAEHYLRIGAMLLRDPGPGFSTARYLEAHPHLAAAGINPLVHYLTVGEGRDGVRAHAPVDGEALEQARDAAVHRDLEILRGSPLFDADFYLATYADVRANGGDPLAHFARYGAREGRLPNPYFATREYRDAYMGGDAVGNPLAHYLVTPGSEDFVTSPRFDGRAYLARYPDVARSGRKPLEHYLAIGLGEGRRATPVSPAHLAVPHIVDGRRRRCTVVVPVHDAYDAALDCIHSVLRHTDLSVDALLIVDDASTDPAVRDMLESFAGIDGVRVERNPVNLGYTRTINRAIGLAGSDDVVLLNSDTVVGPHWLRNLKATAHRNDRIGTVTAVSDNAGAFSVVDAAAQAAPAGADADAVARAVAACALEPIEVPTGNGFCMYVKRVLIDEIGAFAADDFPVGYGEENDFCMRALGAGWTHVVDPTTFVRHVRSASFGERRHPLAEAGMARLRQLHPEYEGAIRAFGHSPAFTAARFKIARRLKGMAASGDTPKPRLLFVISTRVGGTPQTNHDLMLALSEVYDCYALCCNRRGIEVLQAGGHDYRLVERYPISEPVRFAVHASGEYDELLKFILVRHGIDCVHVRHLAWHSLNLVDVARSVGVPVVHSFHDFYAICPTVNLIGDDGTFSPDGVIEQAANPLWRDDPTATPMTRAYLQRWQQRMQRALAGCSAFITTSRSAKDLLTQALPDLVARTADFHVIPHGRDFERFEQLAATEEIAGGMRLRVLLPGNITLHKGAELVRQVKALDADGRIEFHVLGKSDPRLEGCVVAHGVYQREQFAALVADIRPHIAAILSIWPETYCHTLTESWACGLPVLGIALGAVGERIERHGGGWLLGYPTTAEALYAELLRIRASSAGRREKIEKVIRWQQGPGRENTTARMAMRYAALYRAAIGRERRLASAPLRRTALVLAGHRLRAADGAAALSACSDRLKRRFGQPVDVIDWSALLRAEAVAYGVVVIGDDAIPAQHRDDVLAAVREIPEGRVYRIAEAALAAIADADSVEAAERAGELLESLG